MWGHQDDDDRPMTASEVIRWEASALGEAHPEDEWVLTNYDVWMRNPYYTGPRTEGHPEDHDRSESDADDFCAPVDLPPHVRNEEAEEVDDIPF